MPSWDRIELQPPHAGRALAGGVLATLILTGLMYLGPLVHVATWNIPAIVGSAVSFNEDVTMAFRPSLWALGWVVYITFTVFFFPLCYAYWVYSYLPGSNTMRGLIYGGLLWLLFQVFLMPMIGQGAFDYHGPAPPVEILSQLVMWLVYGLVLGFIAGQQQVWQQRTHPQRHAT